MKRALVMNHSGLGDLLMMVPCLRELYNQGYMTTLMCREEVKTSHLLDDCPYVDELVEVANPWQSSDFDEQIEFNRGTFTALSSEFDWSGKTEQIDMPFGVHKIDHMAKELGITLTSRNPEVFISKEIKREAQEHIDSTLSEDFLFLHSTVPNHPIHNFDNAEQWTRDNLSYSSVYKPFENNVPKHENINFSFAIMEKALSVVLCSSVFVHCSDALGIWVDAISYGCQDRKVLPVNLDKVLRIREMGSWLERNNRIWGIK